MTKAKDAAPISLEDIALAVEYLMTAQRAILAGEKPGSRRVDEPMRWALVRLGAA